MERPSELQTILITANPHLAAVAEASNITFSMVDLELLGKAERQSGAATPINQHTFADVKLVRRVLKNTHLLVRLNPLNPQSSEEVEKAIDCGADALMFPYFKTAKEVETFRKIVNDRVRTIFLFETSEAAARAEQVLDAISGSEVHFGLNDLMISLGTDSPFDAFAGGLIDWLASLAARKKIVYGIGGVGRLNGANDKVPAELVLAQHARLKSQRVILSRSFMGSDPNNPNLDEVIPAEIEKIQTLFKALLAKTSDELESRRLSFVNAILNAKWK